MQEPKVLYAICEKYSLNGDLVLPKLCIDPEPFCCGTCFNRTCCSSKIDELNQDACNNIKTTTRQTSYYTYETDLNVYWFLLLIAFLIFLFFCIIVIIGKKNKHNRERMRQFGLNQLSYRRTIAENSPGNSSKGIYFFRFISFKNFNFQRC